MPITSVSPEIFCVHKIGKLYIPVYRVYQGNEQYHYWFTCHKNCKMLNSKCFNVKNLPDGHRFDEPSKNPTKVVQEIIAQAIDSGHLDILLPFDEKTLAAARIGAYKPIIKEGTCPVCGNDQFAAGQKVYMTVIVDSQNNWIDDISADESDRPYGPYQCTICGTKTDDLPNEGVQS